MDTANLSGQIRNSRFKSLRHLIGNTPLPEIQFTCCDLYDFDQKMC